MYRFLFETTDTSATNRTLQPYKIIDHETLKFFPRTNTHVKIEKTNVLSVYTTLFTSTPGIIFTMNVQDRRRLLGPGNAKPIQFSSSTTETTSKEESTTPDKESLFIESGLISNSNGSSYLEVTDENKTQYHALLITSVYGPRPIRGSFTSRASLTIQFKEVTLEKFTTGEIKEVCNFLTNIFNAVVNLERYPKSGIDIFLNLIQHSSTDNQETDIASVIPTCINGITLALTNAGIEILDMVSAGRYKGSIASFVKNGDEMVGFWKDDENEDEDIVEIIENCKKQYWKNKDLMISYLAENKQ